MHSCSGRSLASSAHQRHVGRVAGTGGMAAKTPSVGVETGGFFSVPSAVAADETGLHLHHQEHITSTLLPPGVRKRIWAE